jgi:exosortase
MTVQETTGLGPELSASRARQPAASALEWPRSFWLVALLLALLYLPVLAENLTACLRSADFTHCLLIPPLALAVVWLRRGDIVSAGRNPRARGLLIMAMGLGIMAMSYLFRISFFGLWSLIPVLAGAVIALHGLALWRVVSFPILYLFLAGPVPATLYAPISMGIQSVSTGMAAWIMQSCGYVILRTGNQIEIPGYALEVANVCSGFQKLIALVAFALLYGYMLDISWRKRLLLVLATYPIAALANAIRIAGLVAVISAGGYPAFHTAHEYADLLALVLCFGMFVLTGKMLGCRKLRFLI